MAANLDNYRDIFDKKAFAHIATVGKDGTPHIAPVGWSYDADHDSVEVGGRAFDRSKKYHDAARSGRAAIVIDDLVSVDPWQPRGLEIRGSAEALDDPPRIRIRPRRVVSWGLEDDDSFRRHARTVG
jgi:pyridoxamine 5'-phosphate oxidase family protein